MSQFPIENRGRAQFLTAVKSLLDSTSLINALSDFHFLVYLITNHFSPVSTELSSSLTLCDQGRGTAAGSGFPKA